MTRFVAGARRGAPAARHARAPARLCAPRRRSAADALAASLGGRSPRPGSRRCASPRATRGARTSRPPRSPRTSPAATSRAAPRRTPRDASARRNPRRLATAPATPPPTTRRLSVPPRSGRAVPTRVLTPRRARAERRRRARGRRDGTRAGGGTPRMLRLPKRSLRKRESPKRSITAYEPARGPSITARAAKRRTRRWTWTTC